MIDWKDTVMSDEQIGLVNPNECVCGITDARDMCKAQAEITGKIMLEQGRKEVIEGYRKIRACTHIPGYHNLADCSRCEEAKLKEWGVNNG